jgi:hypothetical protein
MVNGIVQMHLMKKQSFLFDNGRRTMLVSQTYLPDLTNADNDILDHRFPTSAILLSNSVAFAHKCRIHWTSTRLVPVSISLRLVMVWKIVTMHMMKRIHSQPRHPLEVCGVFIFVVGISTKNISVLALKKNRLIVPTLYVPSIEMKLDRVPIRTISFVSMIISARKMVDAMENSIASTEKMNTGVHWVLSTIKLTIVSTSVPF